VDSKTATTLDQLYVGAAVWVRNSKPTKKNPKNCYGPFMVKTLDKKKGLIEIGNETEKWAVKAEDLLTSPTD